jgi:hypothetical protein
VSKELDMDTDGTDIDELIKTSKRFGIQAVRRDDLDKEKVLSFLKKRIPIVLLVRPKDKKDEHFLIVVGKYDGGLIFRDTSQYAYTYTPYNELLKRWHKSTNGYLGAAFVGNTANTYNSKEVIKV